MSVAKLRPGDLPGWPRLLRRELAAAYCGVSPGTFDRLVRDGRFPAPIRSGLRIAQWDRLALDRIIDLRSGIANDAGGWDG